MFDTYDFCANINKKDKETFNDALFKKIIDDNIRIRLTYDNKLLGCTIELDENY